MNRFLAALIIGLATVLLPMQANALRVEPSIIQASSPQRVYFGSTYFYCYPNRLIVPVNNRYSRKTLSDMALLTRHLGWRHVYLLSPEHPDGVPSRYSRYADRYFSRQGIRYSYYYPRSIRTPYYFNDYGFRDNRSYRHHRYSNPHRSHRGGSKGGFYFRFSF